jgi:methylmalonyl-CoA mutase cobalamin-binding subunit
MTGEWWREDACSFLEVTIATAELHRAARSLVRNDSLVASKRGRVLVSAAPGSQHTLGMLLVAERLSRMGWAVEVGWPFQSPEDALSSGCDVVGLSVSGSRDFEWAARWSERVMDRLPNASVLFGGDGASELATSWGLCDRGCARGAVLSALEPAS